MRVLFDYQIFVEQEYGGISRYFSELAAGLRTLPGVSSRIVAPLHVSQYLRSSEGGAVLGWYVRPVRGTGRAIKTLSRMASPLAASFERPDVVHETYYASRPALRVAAPRVLTVFDMIHELHPESFPAGDPIAGRKRSAIARADRILCISENTRRDLLSLFPIPEDRVTVTHLGFGNLPVPGFSAVDRIGPAPYLLFVGRRPGYKNFLGLARAVASRPSLRDHLRIACFGGGPATARECEALASLGLAGDQVVFLEGGDEVLAALYRGAAALVYPSRYEGFGIPPLEAMSVGCPVVCSSTSSIPEVVGPAGEYFDPDEVESIASAIEVVISSPSRRKELMELGHVRCREFSWDRCSRETLAVYRTLVR